MAFVHADANLVNLFENLSSAQRLTRHPIPVPIHPRVPAVLQVPSAWVWVNGRVVGEAAEGRPLNLVGGLLVGTVMVIVEAGSQRLESRETIHPNQWTQASFSLKRWIEPAR